MNIAIKMKKLNPPKNYREIVPRVCAYCERYIEIDPAWTCERWFDYKKLEHHTFRDMSCLLYTSPSPRDRTRSRMPSSA